MTRKLFVIASVVALAAALFSSSATAGTAKVDVTGSHITCNSAFGTVQFAPPLKLATPAPYKVKIKATFSTCGVTGAVATVVSGAFSGSFTTTGNFCNGGVTLTGKATASWKADSTTPITPTKSEITPGAFLSFQGATTSPFGTQYPVHQLGSFAFTGAFNGGTGGFGSTIRWVVNEDSAAFNTGCFNASSPGLKTLHIGETQLQFS